MLRESRLASSRRSDETLIGALARAWSQTEDAGATTVVVFGPVPADRAIQDLSTAHEVYLRARQRGVGVEIDLAGVAPAMAETH